MRFRACTALALLGALTATAMAEAPVIGADPGDLLDSLVDAAAQRLQTADAVAAFKWRAQSSIEDPPRVNQVLAAVSADATAHRIDPAYVTQIFNDQINATDAIEYSRFAQWKLDPANAPASAVDLSASRSTIDTLNRQMVDEIAAHWDVLQSPACAGALRDAKNTVTSSRQLDGLYPAALDFATRSYCR